MGKNNYDSNELLEEDLFDNYVTSSQDPDLSGDENERITFKYDETNSGKCLLNVREENKNIGAYKDVTVSGSTIMNQCGSLLTRKKHQISGSRKQKFFYKSYVPLQKENLYHWCMQRQCYFLPYFGNQVVI